MKFKAGDKVRIVYNSNGSGIVKQAMNKIGIIKSIYTSERFGMIHVQFDEIIFSGISLIGFCENEIEKTPVKGEQLLFEFTY